MTVAELFAHIGVKADTGKVQGFDKAMRNVKVGMVAATAAATGVSLAIRKIADDAVKAAVEFKQFETETGASAQTLQRWQSVAEQTNQSASDVTNAIKAIADNQQKIRLGQGNISAYQLLGIDPTDKDPFEILEEVREGIDGLAPAMQKHVASQLGISAGLLQTLNLSEEQFDLMANRAFIISPLAIDTLTKLKTEMDLGTRAIGYIKAQIAVGLAPEITKLRKKFTDFIKVHEKGIVEGFKKAFTVVKAYVSAIMSTISAINRIVTATIGWKAAIGLVVVAVAAMNKALLLSPIGIITASILLLIAIIDDLYRYSQGRPSLLGELEDQFPMLENMMDNLKLFADVIQKLWSGDTGDISKILEDWGIWGDILEGIVNSIKFIKEALTGEFSAKLVAQADEARAEGKEGKADFLDFFGADFKSDRFYDAAPGVLKQDWWKQVFSGGGFGNVTAEQARAMNNVTININGSGDPAATAAAVERVLQRQNTRTSAQRGNNE